MNLWTENTPDRFWLCQPDFPSEIWTQAIENAAPLLGLTPSPQDADTLLALTLGEGRFGPHPWHLSPSRWIYYRVKPLLPQRLRKIMKRTYFSAATETAHKFNWPIDDRYARFLFETLRQALLLSGNQAVTYRSFWPQGRQFGLALTHDVESGGGQSYVSTVADLEEGMGFRSSFNFVPERYRIDHGLMRDLQARGFEVGVHGLKHDGKLYASRRVFQARAQRINRHLQEFGAVGFRSPLMHRNPYWLQDLQADYDLSFFDTDPYEPIPGGVMTVWPFFMGKFVELPYTLAQDSTLAFIFKERTPRIWLEKLDFLHHTHGMALINTHPDYLKNEYVCKMYGDFLQSLNAIRDEFWAALPAEMAQWWRLRTAEPETSAELSWSRARVDGEELCLEGAGAFLFEAPAIESPELIERCNDGGIYEHKQ